MESAGSLNFMGIPIMRMITATTAFKMPLYDISFLLSVYSVSSTVFRNTEKLSCANEVSASKLKVKNLLLSDRSLSGRQFRIFSDSQSIELLCLEQLYPSNVLQPRSPAMDYRGCFALQILMEVTI